MIGDDAGRVKRWRELLDSERDASALYARIAEAETGERRTFFEELAAVERRHAAHWEEKITGWCPIPRWSWASRVREPRTR